MRRELLLFFFLAAASVVAGLENPSVRILFPREDDVIKEGSTIIAILVSNFTMPQEGYLRIDLNGHDIAHQTPHLDEEFNANINIGIPSLTQGLHTVRAVLVGSDGVEREEEEEVEFLVEGNIDDSGEHQGDEKGNNKKKKNNSSSSNLDSSFGDDDDEQRFLSAIDTWCGNVKVGSACTTTNTSNVCSNNGKCVRGHCVCHGDWVGEVCDHNLFEDPVFLPDVDVHVQLSRCLIAVHSNHGRRELMHDLQDLHSVEQCTRSRTRTYGTRFHGFGAQMHFLTVALTDSLRGGWGMVMHGNWTYSMHDECVVKGHTCHFEPHFPGCDTTLIADTENIHHHPPADSHYVPERYKNMGHGVMWFRSMLGYFLLRPNVILESKLSLVKAAVGWGGEERVVGVHVREGDSCNHAEISDFKPKCHHFDEHAGHLLTMRDKYGVRTFFLATDSEAAVESAQQFAASSGMKLLYIRMDRTIFDARWFLEFRMHFGIVNRRTVSESAIIDLLLLSQCDYFIGALSGQMTRLALELMYVRKGFMPPYVSLDYPYCFHFMEKKRVGNFGEKNC